MGYPPPPRWGDTARLSRKCVQPPRSRRVEGGPRADECQVRPRLGEDGYQEAAGAIAKENVPPPAQEPSQGTVCTSLCCVPLPQAPLQHSRAFLWCPERGIMSPCSAPCCRVTACPTLGCGGRCYLQGFSEFPCSQSVSLQIPWKYKNVIQQKTHTVSGFI